MRLGSAQVGPERRRVRELASRKGVPLPVRGFRPESSLVERVLFDDEEETLSIWLRTRRAYVYEGVPRTIYEALRGAASAGRFFNEAIRGRFACRPLGRRVRPG